MHKVWKLLLLSSCLAASFAAGAQDDDRKPKDKDDAVEYNFDSSPTLAVPGDWNSQNAKLEFYEGTLWMRQKFNAAPKDGKRYFLYFGAVNYEAHVYLNGKNFGSHKGGFTPFQFEVTGHLLKGENTVIVKADNTRHQDDIPTVNTDWWNYGGITRDVLLAGAQRAQEVTIAIAELGIRTVVRADANGRAAVCASRAICA